MSLNYSSNKEKKKKEESIIKEKVKDTGERKRRTIFVSPFLFSLSHTHTFSLLFFLQGIGSLLSKASNLVQCINLDRFKPVEDEHELMLEAARLMTVNEFSAGEWNS